MDRDESMLRATLKGQKISALEDARGIAHKMIVQDWAMHTRLPGEPEIKNEAFDSVIEAVAEKIRGGETPEQLRAFVIAAFREWEAGRR